MQNRRTEQGSRATKKWLSIVVFECNDPMTVLHIRYIYIYSMKCFANGAHRSTANGSSMSVALYSSMH